MQRIQAYTMLLLVPFIEKNRMPIAENTETVPKQMSYAKIVSIKRLPNG